MGQKAAKLSSSSSIDDPETKRSALPENVAIFSSPSSGQIYSDPTHPQRYVHQPTNVSAVSATHHHVLRPGPLHMHVAANTKAVTDDDDDAVNHPSMFYYTVAK